MAAKAKPEPLEIRLLGELSLLRGGRPLALPQSKKTRALLAWLVLNPRPQRRERLSALLWDVADDPRAALRWSLSKLRPLVNDEAERLVAGRENIEFRPEGAGIDLLQARSELAGGLDGLETPRLRAIADLFRGELCEGLELPDFLDFHTWLAAQREETRRTRAAVLHALVRRLPPEESLPYARVLVALDPEDNSRAELIRLLRKTGRAVEAEGQAHAARISAGEAGPAQPEPAPARPARPVGPPLVGRQAEMTTLQGTLEATAARGRLHATVLAAEPGMGKSRLLAELMEAARRRGATVMHCRSFELERWRAYGPWIDALQAFPQAVLGPRLTEALAPLIQGTAAPDPVSREGMFGAAVELIAARAHSAPPVLVVLDDVQWSDESTVSLLHYVVRMSRHRPVMLALAARPGELPDNPPAYRLLRGLEREFGARPLTLSPLQRPDIEKLTGVPDPSIYAECGGNPLFALELARARKAAPEAAARTLAESVRERLERLPPECIEILRWAAVIGAGFAPSLLQCLASGAFEQQVEALEKLERHGFIRSLDGRNYGFSHEYLRRAVYADLGEPRRRMLHSRVAAMLQERGADAADIAHHAALAGDFGVAAGAFMEAARRSLRLFANAEAHANARRGLELAARLDDPDRTRLQIELRHLQATARKPEDVAAAADEIEQLAQRAYDMGCHEHARMGFHVASWLRWETGDWAHAQRQTLRAEAASRAATPAQRALGMSEAARCLVMLERDLPRAHAMLQEATALSRASGFEPAAIADTEGMLRAREGNREEALAKFERAWEIARREQLRHDEYQALEHAVMAELDTDHYAEAITRAETLLELAARLEGGSEAPFARALHALSRCATGDPQGAPQFEAALEELRRLDAKFRLAYALSRAAWLDVRRERLDLAESRAAEALRAAEVLQRPTESALAHACLAACVRGPEAKRHAEKAREVPPALVAAPVRRMIELLLPAEAPRARKAKARR